MIFQTYSSIADRNLSKGFQEILYYTNEVTMGWMANMILIAIFVITLMGIYNSKRDFIMGLVIAGFFTFIIAVLFWLADFISGWTLVFVAVISIVCFILTFIGHRNVG
jgi:riboflavin transporter FmnP